MQMFEYPYVIITALIIIILLMGLIGLYFTIKSVKTAKGTVEKDFSSKVKIEYDYEKARMDRRNRCVVYASIFLDGMERLYPQTKAVRVYEQIKKVLLQHFCLNINGEISCCGNDDFVAVNNFNSDEIA